jgi:hypothetical protein
LTGAREPFPGALNWRNIVTNDSSVKIGERLLNRIRGEYRDMPVLRLTQAQAQRLWSLDKQTCADVLDILVDAKFLHQTGDGKYVR